MGLSLLIPSCGDGEDEGERHMEVVALGLCILAAYLIRSNKFYYLPQSAASLVVGLILGGLAKLFYPSKVELDFLSFDAELFYFLLLPLIIFEAGYTLKKARFFRNILAITLYAVFGTLVSTFVVGYLTYLAGVAGLVSISTANPMEPLLFGALISAVDPVATLSIMGAAELNCDPLLYSLVFGESVLNDAVSIVLFRTFLAEYHREVQYTAATLPSTLLDFSALSLGSLLVGALIGLSCSFLCKHSRIRDYPKFEISILFLFAYGSYAFAEAVELSGIMALFFNGLILSHYNSYNLSPASQVTAEYIFAALATLAEFFVFLYMGTGVFAGRFKAWDWAFIALALLFCLIGRVLNIAIFSAVANIWRSEKISGGMQVVMCFAGLRGAIAFALSQSMPGNSKDAYESTTLIIVLFTTIVSGGLTAPLLEKMGVKARNSRADEEAFGAEVSQFEYLMDGQHVGDTPPRKPQPQLGQLGGLASPGPGTFLQEQEESRGRVGAHGLWSKIDNSYMKPLFGGSAPRHDTSHRNSAAGLLAERASF